uniref:Uncharacterized protein n=1 Tax=Chelonoidis abingdonii TaxID=106734 RepID=A0A8C0H7H7_CHEAB
APLTDLPVGHADESLIHQLVRLGVPRLPLHDVAFCGFIGQGDSGDLVGRRGRDCPGRVDHGHEPHEAQAGGGEVDLVHVKLEPPGKLVLGQVEVAEAWESRECQRELQPDTSALCTIIPALLVLTTPRVHACACTHTHTHTVFCS